MRESLSCITTIRYYLFSLDQSNLDSMSQRNRRRNMDNEVRMVLLGKTGNGKKISAYICNKTDNIATFREKFIW